MFKVVCCRSVVCGKGLTIIVSKNRNPPVTARSLIIWQTTVWLFVLLGFYSVFNIISVLSRHIFNYSWSLGKQTSTWLGNVTCPNAPHHDSRTAIGGRTRNAWFQVPNANHSTTADSSAVRKVSHLNLPFSTTKCFLTHLQKRWELNLATCRSFLMPAADNFCKHCIKSLHLQQCFQLYSKIDLSFIESFHVFGYQSFLNGKWLSS